MRRWAKRAGASVALWAALGCPGTVPRPEGAPAGEPELRIAIAAGGANASIGGSESGELFVSEAATGVPVGSVPAGVRWVVVPDSIDSTRLRLMRPTTDSVRTAALRGITVVNVTENRFVVANGRRYRGRITVSAGRGGLTVVNRVGVESYIAGVVGPEIGARRPDEIDAVLAQAVVSRSFAIKNRGRWDAFGFDAYADTRDQVYLGVAVETNQVWDAVRRTAGQVLEYGGDVIDAYFHSTCGRGDIRIPGPDVRAVLRPDADRMLSSAAFQLAVTRGASGEVDRLVAVGAGSGHAVGMCQWGAIGRARAGQDYRKILSTYFPGTKIEKIY